MEYRLNKLEEKTTNNFKVNELVVDFEVPKYQSSSNFHLEGDTSLLQIESKIKKEPLKSKIGLEFNEFLEVSIRIPQDTKIEEPIIIDYFLKEGEALIDKIIIHFEKGSSANFILKYHSKENANAFHHLKEVLVSEENSEGSITLINDMNSTSKNFMAVEVEEEKGSEITHNIIDMGGSIRVYNGYGELKEGAKHFLNNIYYGEKKEIIDMNYYLKNIGKSSVNKIQVEGAIKDYCEKVFRGIIDFKKGCENAIGEENENCLLLSDTCRSRSLPEMLCAEEKVTGTHGVSSGKISEQEQFYLMSRGYSKEEAQKLMVLSHFYKLIEKIPSTKIKEEVIKRLEQKLEKEEN